MTLLRAGIGRRAPRARLPDPPRAGAACAAATRSWCSTTSTAQEWTACRWAAGSAPRCTACSRTTASAATSSLVVARERGKEFVSAGRVVRRGARAGPRRRGRRDGRAPRPGRHRRADRRGRRRPAEPRRSTAVTGLPDVHGLHDVVAAVQARASYLRCSPSAPATTGGSRAPTSSPTRTACAGRSTPPPPGGARPTPRWPPRCTPRPTPSGCRASPSPPTRWGCRSRPRHRPSPQSASPATARPSWRSSTPRAGTMGAAEVARMVVDEHLAPFVAAVRATTKIGERLAVGQRRGVDRRHLPGRARRRAGGRSRVRARAEELFAAAPLPRRSRRLHVRRGAAERSAGTGTGPAAASGTRRRRARTATTAASTTRRARGPAPRRPDREHGAVIWYVTNVDTEVLALRAAVEALPRRLPAGARRSAVDLRRPPGPRRAPPASSCACCGGGAPGRTASTSCAPTCLRAGHPVPGLRRRGRARRRADRAVDRARARSSPKPSPTW